MMEIFLLIILVLATIWDAFTTVYGTLTVLGDGPLQIAAALLFSALILGFVLNTRRIFKWRGNVFSVFAKFLWFVAMIYDFITSWIANRDIIVPDVSSFTQGVILLGLTVLVTGSPILLSGLWDRRFNKTDQTGEQVTGYP